jgi:hypothetical protein
MRITNLQRLMTTIMALTLGLLLSSQAGAQPLPPPSGTPVLTISGKIGVTNVGSQAVFDAAMLDRFEVRSITTQTPWYPNAVTFSGPALKAVLDAVQAQGRRLKVVALNDYAAHVPVSDATDYGIILARRVNGKALSVRDKGPLFLMYPFDAYAELRRDDLYSRAVWQIRHIAVE